jgi:trans-2,3-dihydro-3-hydroxyanthranilate isomerase
VTTSSPYRYRVVDVFTDRPLEGNPLAVFLDARGLDTAAMQKIARELNLSETTFVFPATRSDCDIALRIFTPSQEMKFAGHPTIGSAFVLMDEGIVARDARNFVLEEKVGPVPIRVERDGGRPLIWLRTPAITFGAHFDRALSARALGLETKDVLDIPAQYVSAGNPTIFVALRDKHAVDRASLDLAGLKMMKGDLDEPVCVFLFSPASDGAYSRMFAQEYGIIEDPATGSATGPLAAYMMRNKLVSSKPGTRMISEQGVKMGRRSILHVLICGEEGADGIEVGGYVAPFAEATMNLPQDLVAMSNAS